MGKARLVVLCPKDYIGPLWYKVEPLLQQVADRSATHSLQSIKENLLKDLLQLWLVMEEDVIQAVMTTQVLKHPEKKELVLVHCAGTAIDEWAEDFLDEAEPFARENGCSHISLMGRKGWERMSPQWGFEFEHVKMSKVI